MSFLHFPTALGHTVPPLSLTPTPTATRLAVLTRAHNSPTQVINAVKEIKEVPETIHALGAVVFVMTVEGPVLALLVPLLVRGFREKSTAIKRQCAKIVSNMSKLVDHVMEAAPFLPELIPALDKAREEVSDPEARAVCDRA